MGAEQLPGDLVHSTEQPQQLLLEVSMSMMPHASYMGEGNLIMRLSTVAI